MVFELPSGFRTSDSEVAEFSLGAKLAMFEKLEKLGQHMKPLFVKGYLEGKPSATCYGGHQGRCQCHARSNIREDGIQGQRTDED
jgi:hypothetical protein